MSAYDAFISYSHARDQQLATDLQRGLERFAKPWNRVRALRVFRDTAGLAADPSLWASIERGLASSGSFVLVASPEAAASPWVEREVRWWLEHNESRRLLVVVAAGELVWDERGRRFDPARSTSIPPALYDAFEEEPLWVDARWSRSEEPVPDADRRLEEVVISLSAAVRGVELYELSELADREHRRTIRLARAAQAGLVTLLVLAVAAAVVALRQRNTARDQAEVALSRQLAAASVSASQTNLDVALLLAVRAFRTNANPQTRAALMRANSFSPKLARYVSFDRHVARVAGSGDGRSAVAGLTDGRVAQWSLPDGAPRTLLDLPRAVVSLSMSRDGRVVAAADGTSAMLWRAGRRPAKLPVPAGQKADAVALTPGGKTALVHGGAAEFEGTESVVVFDVRTAARRAVHMHSGEGLGWITSIVATSDDSVLLYDKAYGGWERRRISDWSVQLPWKFVGFGTRQSGSDPSANGEFVTATNGGTPLPVFNTARPGTQERLRYTSEPPITGYGSIALSPSGDRLAAADSGTVYVAPVARAGRPRPGAIELPGNGNVNQGALAFFGDGSKLLSGTRDQVAVWDLRLADRLARRQPAPVPSSCTACRGPLVSVSPDGKWAAVAPDGGGQALLLALTARRAAWHRLPDPELDFSYAPPLWDADGRHVAFPVVSASGGSEVTAPTDVPKLVRTWPAASGHADVIAIGGARDGEPAILVDRGGNIHLQDFETGDLKRTIPGPPSLQAEDAENVTSAAVAIDSPLVATIHAGKATIADTDNGKTLRKLPGTDAAHVAFAGKRLLVQRKSGSLEVWDQRGSARQRVLAGDESYIWAPVGNREGTLVARQRQNGSVVLVDLDSGSVLNTFAAPAETALVKTGLTFSPDGRKLISVTEERDLGEGGQLLERDLSNDGLVELACRTAGRDLTPTEWRAFVGTSAPKDLECE